MLKGVDFLIPIILLPFLLNKLGIQNYGKYAMAMSLAYFLGTIMQYGYSVTAVRGIAEDKIALKRNSNIFSNLFLSNVFLASSIFSLSAILIYFFSEDFYLYFGCILSVFFYSIIPSWYFHGIEDFSRISILNLIGKLINLCLILFLVNSSQDYNKVALYNALGNFFVLVSSILIIRKTYNEFFTTNLNLSGFLTIYKDGYNVFITQIFPNLYNNLSVYLVGGLVNPISAAILNSAMILSEAFNTIVRILSSVIFPFLIKNKSKVNFLSFFCVLLLSVILVFYNIFIHFFGYIIFKENTDFILEVVHYISISSFFLTIYLIFIRNKYFILKLDKILARSTVLSSIISGLVSIPLIYFLGIWGAVISLIFARLLMMLLGLFNLRNI